MTKPYTAPDWQAKALAEGRVSRLTVPMEPQPDSDCIMARVGDTDNPDVFWTQQGPGGYVGGKSWRPPYPPGTVLIVKEAWSYAGEYRKDGAVAVNYRATDWVECYEGDGAPLDSGWLSPVTMPKWMARTHLRVTDCRPVRLGEITGQDCLAEGLDEAYSIPPHGNWLEAHKAVWTGRHGHRHPWEVGRWVWNVAVERIDSEHHGKRTDA